MILKKNRNNEREKTEREKLIEEPGLSWGKWIRYVFLKYWYVFFCLLTDLGLPVQYIENYEIVGYKGYYQMIFSFIVVPFLIAGEVILYRKLFPKEF